MREVKEGVCKSCGQDLVQVRIGGKHLRTYHPAEVLEKGKACPVLMDIPGTSYRSFNVLDFYFMPKVSDE